MANHSPHIYPGLLLDCAASCHMFANRQFFMLYEPLKDEYVTVGGSHKVPVKGQGVVRFRAKLHGEQLCNITLTEVLHIPALGANLVSLGTLQRAGAKLWGMDYGWNAIRYPICRDCRACCLCHRSLYNAPLASSDGALEPFNYTLDADEGFSKWPKSHRAKRF